MESQWWQQLISLCERNFMLCGPKHSLHLCHHCFSVLELTVGAVSCPTATCCHLLIRLPGQLCDVVPCPGQVFSVSTDWLCKDYYMLCSLLQHHPNASSPNFFVPDPNHAPCRLLTNHRNHISLSQFYLYCILLTCDSQSGYQMYSSEFLPTNHCLSWPSQSTLWFSGS